MSQLTVHYCRSLEYVKKNHLEMYEKNEVIIEKMLMELHIWLDWYAGRKGEENGAAYDFTGASSIRHRAKRHHREGIVEATAVFGVIYGQNFAEIIQQEAERHVMDDMRDVVNSVPFQADYPRIFSKNY